MTEIFFRPLRRLDNGGRYKETYIVSQNFIFDFFLKLQNVLFQFDANFNDR